MATLEKIRNKSVLLFIIIIVALLAFILGDFLTSGRTYFGSPTTVAKAGGVTVEYQDYQNRLTQTGEQLRNQGRDYSNDVLTQTVIQGLLTEKLLEKEYNDLGINVTDKEISEALTGPNMHPAAYQMIMYLSQQLQLPEVSGAAVYDAMMNPAKYGLRPQAGEELRRIWANQEKEMEAAMLNQKFMSLVSGLYTYNKLDAKSFYDDNATTRHIEFVTVDAAAVGDDQIEFSDADVQALWNSQKQNYRLDEETREVSYIYVPVEPSSEDRIAAQQTVENAVVALNETEGTQGVANNANFVVNTVNVPRSAVRDNRLKTFLDEHTAGQAAVIAQDGDLYTIAKLNGITTGIDSINISMVQAAPGTNLDSIAALINSGKSAAEVSDGATVQGQDSVWTPLEGIGLTDRMKNALATAAPGKAFVVNDTVQGQPIEGIYKVNKRNAPVNYYDISTIEYTVDPSQATIDKLTGDLRTFVSNNSSAADFVANAEAAGYNVLNDQVSASSTGVGNAAESRRFVKWALDAKKGQVSPMLQDDKQSYIIALAVTDIYDNYMPWTSAAVVNQLRAQARNAKKADKLVADYTGKASDIAGYAGVMNAEKQEGDVAIAGVMPVSIGFAESGIQGAIAAAPKGKLVGPVKGNRAVVVFQVTDINTDNRPFTEAEYGQRFNQTFGMSRRNNALPLLLGADKVDNRSLNFVQSVGE
ncbi:MAG: SurA N-terminal domain-containing protein [Muribaculaceae bacterium]|nr:SurA N-terminal domain-containing protein [Muribaculaceae bacterium]